MDRYSTNLTTNEKSVDGMLGSRIRGAGWKAQTNPLSYGGTPDNYSILSLYEIRQMSGPNGSSLASFELLSVLFKQTTN